MMSNLVFSVFNKKSTRPIVDYFQSGEYQKQILQGNRQEIELELAGMVSHCFTRSVDENKLNLLLKSIEVFNQELVKYRIKLDVTKMVSHIHNELTGSRAMRTISNKCKRVKDLEASFPQVNFRVDGAPEWVMYAKLTVAALIKHCPEYNIATSVDSTGCTMFMRSVNYDMREDWLQFLLDIGSDIQFQSRLYGKAIHNLRFTTDNVEKTFEYLVKHGANPIEIVSHEIHPLIRRLILVTESGGMPERDRFDSFVDQANYLKAKVNRPVIDGKINAMLAIAERFSNYESALQAVDVQPSRKPQVL